MRPEVLAHKLKPPQRDPRPTAKRKPRPEDLQVWNMGRWPTRLSTRGQHRLFVASDGAWRGYFTLCKDILYSPGDPIAPFALLFDARTWTRIDPVPVNRFRGFTYRVPNIPDDKKTQPSTNPRPAHSPLPPSGPPVTPIGDHRH
jgi:hypothetical protein